jgi:hypothetical protein
MKTQADLYEAAAKVMRMCEGTVVKWWECIKFEGLQCNKIGFQPLFNDNADKYEFALAIIEGRPVFVGDELYDRSGSKFKALSLIESENESGIEGSSDEFNGGVYEEINCCSWNPPKPDSPYKVGNKLTVSVNGKIDTYLIIKTNCI